MEFTAPLIPQKPTSKISGKHECDLISSTKIFNPLTK